MFEYLDLTGLNLGVGRFYFAAESETTFTHGIAGDSIEFVSDSKGTVTHFVYRSPEEGERKAARTETRWLQRLDRPRWIMELMTTQQHWENVYGTKAPDQVSWFRPHLDTSLAFIERAARGKEPRIIDVGGGESTLVDDLLASGYGNVTVLDVSRTAIDVTRKRLGDLADRVNWITADATTAEFPANAYDVWHDRALFHFLTKPHDRASYIERVWKSVRLGGHVIIGTFGPEGPLKCSALDVQRYDADSLHGEFGRRFRLIDSLKELHQTPFGTTQQFLYCFCAVE